MGSQEELFDPDKVALDPSEITAVQDAVAAIKRRRGSPPRPKSAGRSKAGYIPPIPLQDLYRWQKIGSDCLALMLLVVREYAMHRDLYPSVIVGEQALEAMDMSIWRRDRALTRLANAGEIEVTRHRGRSPRIKLIGTSSENTRPPTNTTEE
jgi:hypothetical protein